MDSSIKVVARWGCPWPIAAMLALLKAHAVPSLSSSFLNNRRLSSISGTAEQWSP